MDISTAGMAYKKDVAEKYLGTSDRKELEAMLSDWEAFKQVCLLYTSILSFCLLSALETLFDNHPAQKQKRSGTPFPVDPAERPPSA